MTTSVNGTLEMVLSRDLMLTNLAITLSRAGTANPLRGLRYMLNCVLKVVESPMASEVRAAGFVLGSFTPAKADFLGDRTWARWAQWCLCTSSVPRRFFHPQQALVAHRLGPAAAAA